ncbi:PREDICTED: F-box protein At1g22220-like [Nelumbo nucifera]|uniref:F-box protein At1g22220-like n=2 Tax=Nelumbo nucifera TaxID=4432 RepID=A0A1U8ANT8_NELNU|nr:PREDICTED: F-box protein At1g22220-like [Nelumbo nucifera]DAD21920.1 TPA_asm: hypothetical protein HUJ06_023383 [Nelumbo nucifera]
MHLLTSETDVFDRIPDPIVLLIFNHLSDIKSLIRCRAVSKRFNSLVLQADNLVVKVDRVISNETGEWSFLLHLLRSILQSLQDLISLRRLPIQPRNRNSPTEILRGFESIRRLVIELPAGDLRLEKDAVVRWRAEFGKTLKSCVIFAVRTIGEATDDGGGNGGDGDDMDFNGEDGGGGLKLRVVWTISALIAASARHYLLRDVIREHREMESLVLKDREEEGTMVMDKEGLREFREAAVEEEEEQEANQVNNRTVGWKNRTTVPAVRMRMMHEPRLDLPGGVRMKGATLVVVSPAAAQGQGTETADDSAKESEEQKLALDAFGGMFGEAAKALVKSRSYLLEMNSF